MLTGVAAFAIPAALTWRIEPQAIPYIVASAALELAYFALLAAVYSRADYSFAYPVARGSAPVLVLLISVVALNAPVSVLAAAGVVLVTGGVLLVRGVGTEAVDAQSLVLALGVGACIAGYTLVDDHGIRYANAIVLRDRPARERAPVRRRDRTAKAQTRRRPPLAPRRGRHGRGLPARPRRPSPRPPPPAGVGRAAPSLLALAARERAAPAPVAASRETSVVMAAAFSHERSATRLAGSVLVVLGVAAVALG